MSEIILPEVELNIYTPKAPVLAKIHENYIVTKEQSPNIVRHITFDISGTDLVGRVKVGQSVGVQAPGVDEAGKPHKIRLYSVSSENEGEGGNPNLISTTVKRAIDEIDGNQLYVGVCSNYICNLKPGDSVLLTGPSGKRFLLPENPSDFNYVFFATGTGIAPFRGMIRELFKKPYSNRVVLVFGSPYRTDLLYSDYLSELEKKHSNFKYITCISRENRLPDGSKYYVQSALKVEKETLVPILQKENTLLYICGLKGMQTGIYQGLAKAGLSEYLQIREPLTTISPEEWTSEEIRKSIKPSNRTFEEVY